MLLPMTPTPVPVPRPMTLTLTPSRAAGRVGGQRKKLDAGKRREIAESVVAGRKSGADMARLYNVSQPTVSRIVAQYRTTGS